MVRRAYHAVAPTMTAPPPGPGRARLAALRFAGLVLASALASACCKIPGGKRGLLDSGPARGVVLSVPVPGDTPAHFVRTTGGSRRVAFYLPPKCTDPMPSFQGWAIEAAADTTVIGIGGDQPCPHTPYFQLAGDAAHLAARVDAAVKAVSAQLPGGLDTNALVLVGYSQGAAKAEDLAAHSPQHFPRVVLIGAPDPPSVSHLGHARVVATMAGERDRRDLMMTGTAALTHAGIPSRFFLLPGAAHGEMGPEGGKIMREVLAWVWQTAP